MEILDWIVLSTTLFFIVVYGALKTKGSATVKDYLLDNNETPWFTVGISVMATQASAITFLSTPGQAYHDGMGFVQFYFGLPLAMIVIAYTFIPIYHRLKVYTAYEYLEQRFNIETRTLAAILFLIASQFATKQKVDWKRHGLRILLCSVLGVMANMLMFFKGLEITTPINGAVLMMATPIFVLVLNSIINKQRMQFSQAIGITMACIGCVFLMSSKGFSFNATTMPGDILVLINAILYAGYLVFAKELFNHYHTLTVSKYTFLFGAILVLPFGFTELQAARFDGWRWPS